MIKKKITPLTIFSILVFISIIYFLPVAQGVDFTISDVEDDVLRDCPTEEDTGDYHDEIDIIELIVAGRTINLTVAGNLANWNSSYYGSVLFSESIINSGYNQLIFTFPYYALDWDNNSGSIEVTLEKGYHLGGNNYAFEVWNGTGWEDKNTATAANIVDDVTEHSVISEIPVAVEEIPGNMKVVAHTSISIFDGCNFSDLTPLPGSDQGIPSYDLFILICITLGISLILIKKYKK